MGWCYMTKLELVEKWFKRAQSDLITAFHMYEDVYPKELNISCYHSQQAVEKALKAYLLFQDVEPPYTHDLRMLCQLCIKCDAAFSEYLDDCDDLTGYATITRYPDDFEATEQETHQAIDKAFEIYDSVLDLIPGVNEQLRFPKPVEDESQGMQMQ